ncbi:MAG: serine/threonine-protein kinase [Planctomycetota bacterium]
MPENSPQQHLERLSRAVEVFLAHRQSREGSDADLLERHDSLRDLLEPMLAEAASTLPADHSIPAASPRFFGDYKIRREIGRGGMGVVYEAEDVALARRVALKIQPSHLALTPRQIERFRREAAAVGRLQHPGLASVFRVGEVDGTHFFAMEFVEGEDLAKRILAAHDSSGGDASRFGPSPYGLSLGIGPFAEIAEICAQVGETLAYAHAHGVLHRDVKPSNLMITPGGRVRLVDFGLAKDFERDQISQSGELAGTPAYMSPEQITGSGVDARTDVYSLGVVLYELLTLRLPFDAASPHAIMDAVLRGEAAPLRHRQPRVPRDLETICHVALDQDPARRYATAADLAADLRRFLRHEPIQAQASSRLTRVLKLVRRRKAASAAALFGFLALVALPAGFAVYFKQARDELAAEQVETERQRDRAQQILMRAREALDDIYIWLADEQLADEPAMEATRHQLLERASAFYDQFRRLADGDVGLRREAALAESRLGRIVGMLGERERAVGHHRRALAQLEELVRERPADAELAVAAAETQLAMALSSSNNTGEAKSRARHDRAIAKFEALPRDLNRSLAPRRDLGLIDALVARSGFTTELDSGGAAAEADLTAALRVWQGLDAEVQSRTPCRVAHCKILSNLGHMHRSAGELPAAIEAWKGASSAARLLFEQAPHRAKRRRELARSLHGLAEAHALHGEFQLAEGGLLECLELWRALAEDYPSFPGYGLQFAGTLHTMAVMHTSQGRFHRSLPLCDEALEALRDYESSIQVDALRASMHSMRAGIRGAQQGPSAETEAELGRAVALLEAHYKVRPEILALQVQLRGAVSNLAAYLWNNGHPERARPHLETAADLAVVCHTAVPGNPESAAALHASFADLIELELNSGDHRRAATHCDRYREARPEDSETARSAAKFYARCAGLAANEATVATRYADAAVECLQRALAASADVQDELSATEFDALRQRPDFQALLR